MRIVFILLMLLCAANSQAFSCNDEQEEIFSLRSYNYRQFNVTDSPANRDLLFRNICKETCSRVSKKYEDYLANGWRTDIVIPQQLVELSPDKNNSSYKDEIGRLEESCQGPCFKCLCFGVKYVLER